MSVILHTNTEQPTPVKVIDMSTKSSAKAYLTRAPKDTHTKAELQSLHNAIAYTKLLKQEESLAKMDEEELLARPLPKL